MKSDYSIRLAAVTLFTMLAPSVIAGQDGHARHHATAHPENCHYQLIDMGALGGSASCINEPANSHQGTCTPEITPNLFKRCTQFLTAYGSLGPSASIFGP